MDSDGRTIVTGGGTSGEGLQIWDLRNLKEPKMKPSWYPYTEMTEPTINAACFVQGMGILIAACSDEVPVKCFNLKDEGAIVMEYNHLDRSSYTVGVTSDNKSFAMGDSTGRMIVENLNYTSVEPGPSKY
jgi:hypothetical protein